MLMKEDDEALGEGGTKASIDTSGLFLNNRTVTLATQLWEKS